MLARLTRILMAIVTAFVFTGQMEAAAQHCARLAKAAAVEAVAQEADAPCHEASTASVHAAHMQHAEKHQHDAPGHSDRIHDHAKAPPHCACIAALTGCVAFTGATVTAHVEAYAWLTPPEAPFASAKPDPDFRPPRA